MNSKENNIIFKMTDEIAYKLGKFDFPSFYSFVRWYPNKEPFPLAHFFTWGLGMGWPVDTSDNNHNTNWSSISLSGKLKTELFTEISHKLNYIRGRLSSYSVKIEETKIYVCWANSYDIRDFFVE